MPVKKAVVFLFLLLFLVPFCSVVAGYRDTLAGRAVAEAAGHR